MRAPLLAILPFAPLAPAQDCIWTFASPPFKDAPAARSRSAVTFDTLRARLVLYGGHSDTIGTLADTWEWNGFEWQRRLAFGPGPRAGHTLAFDPVNQHFILFGGAADTRTWILDPAEWYNLPAANDIAPSGHVMVHDTINHQTILFGDFPSPTRRLEPSGLWSPINAPGPAPRRDAVAVFDPHRARIILHGGRAGTTILSDVWEFDTAANTWSFRGHGPSPRASAAAAFDPVRRRMVISGGIASDTAWSLTDTWDLDPVSFTWTKRADDGPGARAGASMTYDSARHAVMHFGGGPFPFGLQSNELFRYNGNGTLAVLITQAPASQTFVQGQGLTLSAAAQNATEFQWHRNIYPVFNTAPYSGAQTPTLTINPASACTAGHFVIAMSCGCGTADPGAILTPACYANCDGSSGSPLLTANDFLCFLTRFASNDCYANCDQTHFDPVLTAADFACFLNAYAAGCP
ncbi:MAG: hypothetical protein KF678_04160 [Phycisphaeraceae bacterium]|nr:hypothetical protein [Phycisphaeraceae bacterium]